MYKLEYRQFFSDFAKLFSKKSLSVYVDDFFSDKEDLGKALFGIKSVRIRVILRWGLYSLLSFAFAFLLCGASIFGTHIFGAALLCALQRFVPQAFFGALLFAVLKLDVPLIISLCLVFFARIGLGIYLYYDMLIYSAEDKIKKQKMFFCESPYFCAAIGILGGFCAVQTKLFSSERFSDVFVCILAVILSGACAFLLAKPFDKRLFSQNTKYCSYLLSACLFSLSLLQIPEIGFFLCAALVSLISLYFAKNGALVSAALSLAAALPLGYDYILIFLFFSVFAASLHRAKSPAFSKRFLPSVCALSFSLIISGLIKTQALIVPLMLSSLVSLTLDALKIPEKYPVIDLKVSEKKAAKKPAGLPHNAEFDIAALSKALLDVSEMFLQISQNARALSFEQISDICKENIAAACLACETADDCKIKYLAKYEEYFYKYSFAVSGFSRSADFDTPEYLKNACKNSEKIKAAIKDSVYKKLEENLKFDKAGIEALEYEHFSKMLTSVAKKTALMRKTDYPLCKKLAQISDTLDFEFDGIAAFGTSEVGKKIVIGGVDPAKMPVCAEHIRKTLEKACGFPLTAPEIYDSNGYMTLCLEMGETIFVDCGFAGEKKLGERSSGDEICAFSSPNGHFHTCICDGMGSGENAHLTAKIASAFIEKMLMGGADFEITLDMLNTFLSARKEECFTTVDLLSIDKKSGIAEFFKSGATESVLYRGGKIYPIENGGMPVGIGADVLAKKMSLKVEAGDIIALVSDGIIPNQSDNYALWAALCENADDDVNTLASKIVKCAGRDDDKSVIIIKINAA